MTCNCRTILTTAVDVVGTNLVLTIPAGTVFENCGDYIIRIAQDIPATATNLMNVVIKIGTAATLYPIIRRCGHYLYANQVRTRRNYVLKATADTQRFTLLCGDLRACNCGSTPTIPAPVAETTADTGVGE